MFDIGGPEFLVIAVVALVVIGPERLPKVMGQVGRTYRQLRNMSDELLREAREQWAAGMQEVEDVSNTIAGTWNAATMSEEAGETQPPPAMQQVRTLHDQPATAVNAGPWMLPALHRDTATDVELLGATFAEAPTALPRRLPAAYDPVLDDAGVGGPALMGPAPTEEELAAMAYDLPDEVEAQAGPQATGGMAVEPATYVYRAEEPVANGTYPVAPEPAAPATNGAAHVDAGHATELEATENGVSEETAEAIRERTIVDLYRQGGISLEYASQFLGVDTDEFLAWVELAGGMPASRPATETKPLA